MNGRIQELATQAGMVMYPTGLGISENTLWGDRNIEKFAEMIIKECVEHIRNKAMLAGGKCTVVGEDELRLAKNLAEHFGVEE